VDNNRSINLKKSQTPGQYQITLKELEHPKCIAMYTQYSLISFDTKEEIDEFIDALKFMRDMTYKGKGTL
jgi:hypothetical protein